MSTAEFWAMVVSAVLVIIGTIWDPRDRWERPLLVIAAFATGNLFQIWLRS